MAPFNTQLSDKFMESLELELMGSNVTTYAGDEFFHLATFGAMGTGS